MTSYSGFTYFLLNWMHQNWSDFHSSVERAMRDFVLTETNIEHVLQCRNDIDQWLEEHTTDKAAEAALNAYRVGYWFSDETMHGLEFLHRLRDAFDQAIMERKDVM